MHEDIIIEIKPTLDDLKKFYWFSLFRMPKYKVFYTTVAAVYLLFLVSFVNMIYSEGLKYFFISTIGFGPIIILTPLLLFLSIENTTKRNYMTTVGLEIHCHFLTDAICLESFGKNFRQSTQFEYDGINSAFERTDAFYLIFSFNRFVIIAKRDISSGQESALRSILQNKLGKRFMR